MQAPNQIIPRLILLYKNKCVEFQLTLQNIFVFLFLGKVARITITLMVWKGREIEDQLCLVAVGCR